MAIVMRESRDLVYLVDDEIRVPHAFTTRLGGVSEGVFASLNLGINRGDNRDAVTENYRRITRLLGTAAEDLVFSRQVHGDRVRVVTSVDQAVDIFRPTEHEADGSVTIERDLPLAAFYADCIPILLWDESTGAVGAVHAGWRSTVLDIVGRAVEKLLLLSDGNPQTIRAAIGPGIGPCCFEAGPEVPEAVTACLGDEARFCIQDVAPGKFVVDLKETNRRLLLRRGLLPAHISAAEHCTMCMPELFWSHRFHGEDRGSQAALILSPEG